MGLSFDTKGVHTVHGGECYVHTPATVLPLRHPAAGAAARASEPDVGVQFDELLNAVFAAS